MEEMKRKINGEDLDSTKYRSINKIQED